jgi:hypothetical protein
MGFDVIDAEMREQLKSHELLDLARKFAADYIDGTPLREVYPSDESLSLLERLDDGGHGMPALLS